MIVQNWAKDDRDDCCLCIFDCHISVTGDLALSGKKKSQASPFCFVLWEHDMKEVFAGIKLSQENDHVMICQTAKTLLQAQDTRDYKRLAFFSSSHTQTTALCKSKKKKVKTENEAGLVCKNRQETNYLKWLNVPFGWKERLLWSDTKRDTLKK